MSRERDNEVKRCKRPNCRRATFVETEEGVSVNFRHGPDLHPDVYTVEMMKVYLARKGYVVVEVAKLVKAA